MTKRLKAIAVFLIAALLLNGIACALLTQRGFDIVRRKVFDRVSADISECENIGGALLPIDKCTEGKSVFCFDGVASDEQGNEFAMMMLKYLDGRNGIRYIVDEIPYSAGLVFSYCMNSDNAQILLKSCADKIGNIDDEKLDLYLKISKYSRSRFGNAQKFTLFGCCEDGAADTAECLRFLAGEIYASRPDICDELIMKTLTAENVTDEEYIASVRNDIGTNEGLYKQMFTGMYQHIKHTMDMYGHETENAACENLEYICSEGIAGNYFVIMRKSGIPEDGILLDKSVVFSVYDSDEAGVSGGSYIIVDNRVYRYFSAWADKLNVFFDRTAKRTEICTDDVYFIRSGN